MQYELQSKTDILNDGNGKRVNAGFSLAHRKEVKPSVKYQVIFKHKDKFSINSICKFFEESRSGYYDSLKRMDIPGRDLPLAKKKRMSRRKSQNIRLS